MTEKKREFPREFTNKWSIHENENKKKRPRALAPKLDLATQTSRSSQVNVASDIRMEPKVLKACRSCRKSKIKCHGGDSEGSKCKRCQDYDLECVFEVKVPTTNGQLPDLNWMSSVEERFDKLGNTLDTILQLLGGRQQQQQEQQQEQEQKQKQTLPPDTIDSSHQVTSSCNVPYNDPNFDIESFFPSTSTDAEIIEPRIEGVETTPDYDTELSIVNNGVPSVSYSEAEELFEFFHKHISPNLFGFPISQYTLNSVWTRSPILVAAICTVAATHHPTLSHLYNPLKAELEILAQRIMFESFDNDRQTLDTVIALCVAGFWLPKGLMLTSIALRLAKKLALHINSHDKRSRSQIWYLLYILDGHQSLVYNQSPLIDQDPSASTSRSLLQNDVPDSSSLYADMWLVSQVEFNQVIRCISEGRGWNLIQPASLGVPWQTNMDLDKWMVSWACMLKPTNESNSWPSKSTLVHYNFAKMHINSHAIRTIQKTSGALEDLDKSIDEISVQLHDENDRELASDHLAIAAAQNVLDLTVTDKEVLAVLKYVPVHIPMMLYYAALLLLHSAGSKPISSRTKTFSLVQKLKSVMIDCSNSESSDDLLKTIARGLDSAISRRVSVLGSNDQLSLGENELDEQENVIAAWPGSVPWRN